MDLITLALAKKYTNQKVNEIISFGGFEIVNKLPTTNISHSTVYLLRSGVEEYNIYTEYIYTKTNEWESLGTTVDLNGYVTEENLSTAINIAKEEILQEVGELDTGGGLSYKNQEIDISELVQGNVYPRGIAKGTVVTESGIDHDRFVLVFGYKRDAYEEDYCVKSDTVLYSDNGIEWFKATLPEEGNWVGVVFTGTEFVAVQGKEQVENEWGIREFQSTQTLARSIDGINWTLEQLPYAEYYTNIATISTTRSICLVAEDSPYALIESHTYEGSMWTQVDLHKTMNLKVVTGARLYNHITGDMEDVYVGGGAGEIIIFTKDGVITTSASPLESIESIAYESYNNRIIVTGTDKNYAIASFTSDEETFITGVEWKHYTANILDYGHSEVRTFETYYEDYGEDLPEFIIVTSGGIFGDRYDSTFEQDLGIEDLNDTFVFYNEEINPWNQLSLIVYRGYEYEYDEEYGETYSPVNKILVSFDTRTWGSNRQILEQDDQDITAEVVDTVWPIVQPKVQKMIPEIPNHLEVSHELITGPMIVHDNGHCETAYNANIDRLASIWVYGYRGRNKPNPRYSDDNGRSWQRFSSMDTPTYNPCGAIGTLFVFEDGELNTYWEEVEVIDPETGESWYEEIEVQEYSTRGFYVHNGEGGEMDSNWIQCLFKDESGNEVTIPSDQKYTCVHGTPEDKEKLLLISEDLNTIAYSYNGTVWTVANSNLQEVLTSNNHTRFEFAYSKFIVLSNSAAIYSEDGLNWSRAEVTLGKIPADEENPETDEVFKDLFFGNGLLIALTNAGNRLISTDCINWIQDNNFSFPEAILNGRFVIGTHYSADAIHWYPMQGEFSYPEPGWPDPDIPPRYYEQVAYYPPACAVYLMITDNTTTASGDIQTKKLIVDGFTITEVAPSREVTLAEGDVIQTSNVSRAILPNITRTCSVTIHPSLWASLTEDMSIPVGKFYYVAEFYKELVSPESLVIVSADLATANQYVEANVRCVAQDFGKLTFVCDTIPTETVMATVMIVQAPGIKQIDYIQDPSWEEEWEEEV